MKRFSPRTLVRRRSLLRIGLPIACCLTVLTLSVSMASTAPAGPTGLTAIAGDGTVGLGWKAVSGATGYRVYRTTSVGGARTLLTSSPVTGTTFSDTTALDTHTYYYVVTAVAASGESPISGYTGATPMALTCSTGNAIVLENCFPGTTNWKTQNPLQAANGGIEGFATASSVNAGGSVDLKVRTTADNVPFHVEIYRSGYYGGTQGRLISTIPGLTANSQDPCSYDSTTGLRDCSNWTTAATITTTANWPTGVYLLRIVRDDNGDDNHILLIVRHDGEHASILYGVPTATYQAYNSYGGKSLYDFNSTGDLTVAGSTRAVSVSYDRPYQQSVNGMADWYPNVDVRNVSWLEQQGYDDGLRRELRPRDGGTADRTSRLPLALARRVLVCRDALGDHRGPRCRHLARVPRLERRVLEDPLLGEHGHRRRQPRRDLLQDRLGRRRRSDRPEHVRLARSERPEPAGERPARPDVHRRQRRPHLPLPRLRRAGPRHALAQDVRVEPGCRHARRPSASRRSAGSGTPGSRTARSPQESRP